MNQAKTSVQLKLFQTERGITAFSWMLSAQPEHPNKIYVRDRVPRIGRIHSSTNQR